MNSFLILIFILHSAIADTILDWGVTPEDKKFIVDYHNAIRNKLTLGLIPGQPAATNLKHMSWDDKLASAAQQNTFQCKMKHDKRHDDRFSVGQNLASVWHGSVEGTKNWTMAINMWYNEYPKFHYGPLDPNSKALHYTQVIWADTYLVGCGFTLCTNAPKSWDYYYACNYGPTGNIVGEYPYKTK